MTRVNGHLNICGQPARLDQVDPRGETVQDLVLDGLSQFGACISIGVIER
jgi:hypothetical protein